MTSYHKAPDGIYKKCSTTPEKCQYKGASHIPENVYVKLDAEGRYAKDVNPNGSVETKTAIASAEPGRIQLAPEGFSGLYCLNCRTYLTHEEKDTLTNNSEGMQCPKCRTQIYLELMGVDIEASEAPLLTDEVVRRRSWFHVTSNPNWMDKVLETGDEDEQDQILVHVGSKQATVDRLRDLAKYSKGTYYLYELKIADDARIAPSLFTDDEDACPGKVRDVKKSGYEARGVTRYVNAYEAPGTISLLANPEYLVEGEVREIQI